MIRRASLQDAVEYISDLDDALDRPAPGKGAKADAAHATFNHKLAVARDRGDYAEVLRPDGQPTRFLVKTLPPLVVRRIADDLAGGKVGNLEWLALVFCCALEDVVGPGFDVKHTMTDRYGRRALDSVLVGLPTDVVNEVAMFAWKRSQAIDPKP